MCMLLWNFSSITLVKLFYVFHLAWNSRSGQKLGSLSILDDLYDLVVLPLADARPHRLSHWVVCEGRLFIEKGKL